MATFVILDNDPISSLGSGPSSAGTKTGHRIYHGMGTGNTQRYFGYYPENCRLHPLIHTLLEFTLVQDVVSCRCGEKRTPIDPMWMESRQKNMGMSDILTPDEMNLLVFIYL